jgi:hypothetical protein
VETEFPFKLPAIELEGPSTRQLKPLIEVYVGNTCGFGCLKDVREFLYHSSWFCFGVNQRKWGREIEALELYIHQLLKQDAIQMEGTPIRFLQVIEHVLDSSANMFRS